MIYYRRYIGAYQKRTTRLSMRDHGAYALMLDFYYAEEQPLPLELDDVYDLCKVRTPDDRKAVDKVLRLHFAKQTNGYHNERADHEISVSVQARKNGKGGGRPRTGGGTGNETEPETGSETGSETEEETGPITGEGGGSVHPSTFNHSAVQPSAFQPSTFKGQTHLSGYAPDVDPLAPKKPNGSAFHADAEDVLGYLNRAAGKGYEFRNRSGELTASADRIIARLKQGYTREELREVVHAKCEQWRDDDRMAEYLRPLTLFGKEKFEQYLGELRGQHGDD